MTSLGSAGLAPIEKTGVVSPNGHDQARAIVTKVPDLPLCKRR